MKEKGKVRLMGNRPWQCVRVGLRPFVFKILSALALSARGISLMSVMSWWREAEAMSWAPSGSHALTLVRSRRRATQG